MSLRITIYDIVRFPTSIGSSLESDSDDGVSSSHKNRLFLSMPNPSLRLSSLSACHICLNYDKLRSIAKNHPFFMEKGAVYR